MDFDNEQPSDGKAFWLWSALLLTVKAIFVIVLADIFFYGEELSKGSVGKAMIDGIPVDFHRLAYHYYEGGGFFISGLKALAFQIVGENFLAHRLVGMLTCWAVFWGLWRLVDFHFGRRAAHLAAAVFIFGPSGFQRYSTLSLGIHFEVMALGLPLLDEGLRLLRFRTWNPSPLRRFLVGLAAGFALFFSYQTALILAWLGLWVLVLRWRWLFSKAAWMLLLGALVGISPMLYMAWHVGGDLLNVHGDGLMEVQSNSQKIRGYFESVFVGLTPITLAARVIYPLAAILGGLILLTRRNQNQWPSIYLLGYVGLWSLAWATGPFVADSHEHFFAWLRMAPITLVLMAVGAAGLDRGWNAHVLLIKALSRTTLVAVLLLGLFETGVIIQKGQWQTPSANWTQLTQYKGYNYRGHFRMLFAHLPDQQPETLKALLHYKEDDTRILYADIAHCYAATCDPSMDAMAVLEGLKRIDPDGLDQFVLGMGPVFARAHPGDVRAMLAGLDQYPEQWRAPFAESIGYQGTGWVADKESFLAEAQSCVDAPHLEAYSRGMGARIVRILELFPFGRELVMRPDRVTEYIQTFPPQLVEWVLEGAAQERERNRL